MDPEIGRKTIPKPKEITPAEFMVGGLALVIGVVGVLVLFSIMWALPLYFIWNSVLVKVISGLLPVTFLQAWAISFLLGMFRTKCSSKS